MTPTGGGKNRRKTLAQVVDHQIDSFIKTSVLFNPLQKKKIPAQNQLDKGRALSRAVCAKIDEGDIHGSIRLLTSESGLAEHIDNTKSQLEAKELPVPPERRAFPDASCPLLLLRADEVKQAVISFQHGSAAGISAKIVWQKERIVNSFLVF